MYTSYKPVSLPDIPKVGNLNHSLVTDDIFSIPDNLDDQEATKVPATTLSSSLVSYATLIYQVLLDTFLHIFLIHNMADEEI